MTVTGGAHIRKGISSEGEEEHKGENVHRPCDVCGKEAIGMQIMGCCTSIVCEEHAEPMLRELKPGELKEWGICCFHRFGEPFPKG